MCLPHQDTAFSTSCGNQPRTAQRRPAPKAERFIKLPEWLLTADGISLRAKLVMAALLNYRDFHARCDPTQEHLAKTLRIGLATVERALRELRKAGWITSRRGQHGCIYELLQNGSRSLTVMDSDPQGEGSGAQHPYLYIDSNRDGASRRSPSRRKPLNTSVPDVPRKTAMSETLRCYYEQERRKAGNA